MFLALGMNPLAHAGMDDDPILTKVMIGQFEKRYNDGEDPLILEADAWIGKDLHKAWFKIDAEQVDGKLEEFEIQALYSRAVDPYWDLQIGWKHNSKPKPDSNWLALGFKGLAPYWFEVDAAAFVSDSGQVNLRLGAEYELMLTQRWVLSPEAEVNFYTKDDDAREIGSGLSDTQLGLRLRYEIKREFAPYIGVNWTRKYGGTADHARSAGEDTNDVQLVAGIRAWF
ncbi:MAG: copper resistance protein B [gamma proteobacterium symbiont of Ctena orbiculata]